MKQTKRKQFLFLRSYFDVLNKIPDDKDKLEFLLAVINKQFLDVDPENLGLIAELSYEGQRHSIEASVKGYCDKMKTDLLGNSLIIKPIPPLVKGVNKNQNTPCQQEEEKEEEKEKEEEQLVLPEKKQKQILTHEIQILISEFYPEIKKLNKQLKHQECESLLRVAKNNFELITEVFDAMENHKDLTKKYKSVYYTANNWIKNRIQKQENEKSNTKKPNKHVDASDLSNWGA